MKRIIIILLLFISANLVAQDKITRPDGRAYSIKIIEDRDKKLVYYSLDDPNKEIKIISKARLFSYQIAGFEKITGRTMRNIPPSNRTAGDELMIANRKLNIGFVLMTTGSMVGLSALLVSDYDIIKPLGIVSGIISITGIIYSISGIQHLGKAGIKLNDSISTSLYLIPSGNGVGLVYNF